MPPLLRKNNSPRIRAGFALEPELGEEPPVLAPGVTLLKVLLDRLLGLLALSRLAKGVGGDGALERLELESVTGREQVGVVDDLRDTHTHWVSTTIRKPAEDLRNSP